MRATPELNGIEWRKSGYSGGDQGSECVEVGVGVPGVVPVLSFAPAAWAAFVTSVRDGGLPVR